MKVSSITLLLFLSVNLLWGQGSTDLSLIFDSANVAYTEGRYSEAQEGYELIVEEHLHFQSEFNLGNTYFKQGKLGLALLHFERAKQLNPSDSDLENNLILANARVIDRIEALPTAGIEDMWEQLMSPGRYVLWFRLMIVFWTLGFILLAWRIWQSSIGNRRISSTVGGALLAVGIIFICLAYGSSKRIDQSQEGIIMVNQANVLSEPSLSATTLFVLHEGTKVRILQEVDGQYEVVIANGNVGWLTVGSLEEI